MSEKFKKLTKECEMSKSEELYGTKCTWSL